VIGRVGAGLVATGAILAATSGDAFVVAGFALIFLGALVLAVALEPVIGPRPSGPVAVPEAAGVEPTGGGRLIARPAQPAGSPS
jgi:hypothetical protein